MFLASASARTRRRLHGDRARLLQGHALPRRRLGDPRQRRQPGHADDGRAAASSCRSPRSRSSSPGSRSPASRRSRASWPRTRSSRTRSSASDYGAVDRRRSRRRAHRPLHDPRGALVVLRQRALPRRPTRRGRGARRARRRGRELRRLADRRLRRAAAHARARTTTRTSRRGRWSFPSLVLAGLCGRRSGSSTCRSRRSSSSPTGSIRCSRASRIHADLVRRRGRVARPLVGVDRRSSASRSPGASYRRGPRRPATRPARRAPRRRSAGSSATPTTSTSGISRAGRRAGARRFADWLATVFDAKVIDGAVNGVGRLVRGAGGGLRQVQTGLVRNYALGVVLGAVGSCSLRHRLVRVADATSVGRLPDPHRDHRSRPLLGALLGAAASRGRAVRARTRGRVHRHRRDRSGSPAGCCGTSRPGDAGFQFVEEHRWIDVARRPLHRRRRRHQPLHGRAHRAAVPDRSARLGQARPAGEGVHLLVPAARGARSWGSSSSLDLICFFVFWEFVLVPMYFLIAGWGHERRVYAAMKFFLYTVAGSAFLLVVDPRARRSCTSRPPASSPSTSGCSTEWNGLAGTTEARPGCSSAFMAAFAIKAPLFPFHTWLPDVAHRGADRGLGGAGRRDPEDGRVRVPAVLVRAVPAGVGRPRAAAADAGGDRHLYGAIVAAMQTDLKRLIAYSSVAHMGFIVLGIFSLTTHGPRRRRVHDAQPPLTTGALFLVVGMLYERRHTREIVRLRRPLEGRCPILGGFFLVATFAGDRPARLLRLRRRVPRAARHVRRAPAVGGRRRVRRDPRRGLHALGVPAGVHRRAEGENAKLHDLTFREVVVVVPLLGAEPVPRPLPEAGASTGSSPR